MTIFPCCTSSTCFGQKATHTPQPLHQETFVISFFTATPPKIFEIGLCFRHPFQNSSELCEDPSFKSIRIAKTLHLIKTSIPFRRSLDPKALKCFLHYKRFIR